jgi:hypothetical protein
METILDSDSIWLCTCIPRQFPAIIVPFLGSKFYGCGKEGQCVTNQHSKRRSRDISPNLNSFCPTKIPWSRCCPTRSSECVVALGNKSNKTFSYIQLRHQRQNLLANCNTITTIIETKSSISSPFSYHLAFALDCLKGMSKF